MKQPDGVFQLILMLDKYALCDLYIDEFPGRPMPLYGPQYPCDESLFVTD